MPGAEGVVDTDSKGHMEKFSETQHCLCLVVTLLHTLTKDIIMCDLNAYILFCINHTMIKLILEEYIDHKIRRSNREIGLCSQKE